MYYFQTYSEYNGGLSKCQDLTNVFLTLFSGKGELIMQINNFIEQNTKRKFIQFKKKKARYIYFICEDDGEIIYIGATSYLVSRIAKHGVFGECGRFARKKVFYFIVEHNEMACDIERIFIQTIRPKHNVHDNRRGKIKKKKVKKKKIKIRVTNSKWVTKEIIYLCGGSRKQAAKEIGISLSYFYRIERKLEPSIRLYQKLIQKLSKLITLNLN